MLLPEQVVPLTPVEQRYSQTEREALGVLFACEHFHLYIYGAKFNIITDHKPLERIFTNPAARSNERLERWVLKLQPYHFTISYSPGKTNPADYLSRHPLATTHPSTTSDQAEEYIAFLADYTTPKAMIVSEVKQSTRADPTLQAVIEALCNNSWQSTFETPSPLVNSQDLHALYNIRDELSVSDNHDLLLRSTVLSSHMPFVNMLSTSSMKVIKALPKPNNCSAKRFGFLESMGLRKS
jgi:hypothetical protein